MKKNFFKKLTITASLLFFATANQMVALADSKNPFTKATKDIDSFGKNVKTISYVIAGACLLVAGLVYMFGDVGKKKSTSWMSGIFIGLLVISFASALVGYFYGIGE